MARRNTTILAAVALLGVSTGLESSAQAQPSLNWYGRFFDITAPARLDEVTDSVVFENHLYVTGEVRISANTSFFATLKYEITATGGVALSPVAQVYHPSTSSRGMRRAVAIDAANVTIPPDDGGPTGTIRPTVYVTGIVPGADGSTDCFIIAYDKDLNEIWDERFDADGLDDAPVDISAFGDRVVVTGTSEFAAAGSEIFTVMYDAVAEAPLWTSYLGSGGTEDDVVVGVVYDGASSVYVAGTTWSGGLTKVTATKYNATTGHTIGTWPRLFAPPDKAAVATCMVYDRVLGFGPYVGGITGSGSAAINHPNIIVAGTTQSATGDLNMVALKYQTNFDQQNGFTLSTLQWGGNPRIHSESAGGDDVPATLKRTGETPSTASFFMAGRSWGGTTTADDMLSVHYTDPNN